MPRERALGTAFRLLDLGFFRVGGEQYAEDNGSYGLATIEKQHVHVAGDEVVFDYPAKSGQERLIAVADQPSSPRCASCARGAAADASCSPSTTGRRLARPHVHRHQPPT